MSWARFDDRYHDNRKVKRAWRRHPRAVGLHAMAVTYASMHETDGLIDAEWLEEKLPAKNEREKCLAALTSAGLFEPVQDGDFRVHDFLDYNLSRVQRDEQRDLKTTRQRKWRETRGSASTNGVVDASTDASTHRHGDTAPPPTPSRPVLSPQPPASGGQRRQQKFQEELRQFVADHFPGVAPGLVAHQASELRSLGREPTVDALRPLLEENTA